MSVPADPVAAQAIAWRVRLASGSASRQDWRRCADWRRADPQHELAWQRLERLGQQLADASRPLARATLAVAEMNLQRRSSLKQLLLLAVLVAGGVATQHLLPW
ncbi:hypothetical protein D9M68_250670 [compost metagenome]